MADRQEMATLWRCDTPDPRAVCSRCGKPAKGFAMLDGKRLCHGDEVPSCYELAQLDAYQERQWHDAGRIVADLLGLRYDEGGGFGHG